MIKKLLLTTGLLLLGLVMMVGWTVGRSYQHGHEAKEYARQAMERMSRHWDQQTFVAEFVPGALPEGADAQRRLLKTLRGHLGPLKSLEVMRWHATRNLRTGGEDNWVVQLSARGEFASGVAEMRLTCRKQEGEWRLLRLLFDEFKDAAELGVLI